MRGHYAAPVGELLLMTVTAKAVGCVAMRDPGAGVLEMKWMPSAGAVLRLEIGRHAGVAADGST